MRVYLVQHGMAFSKEQDPERSLTEEGKEASRLVSQRLKAAGSEVFVIWHSGKTRARQTAEIFAENLQIPRRIMEHSNLAPKDSVEPIAEELRKMSHDLMIVGHLPFLSKLAGLLLTGDAEAEPVGFSNSGVVCLEQGEKTWQLRWALVPQLLK
ncbi:MAG TPA: phosphohistidine phosphatase SixA [Sediminispirochaeta sp.]|nr:phosphohistidine phosphatase SixA [Sediminispirochaeta sp.]